MALIIHAPARLMVSVTELYSTAVEDVDVVESVGEVGVNSKARGISALGYRVNGSSGELGSGEDERPVRREVLESSRLCRGRDIEKDPTSSCVWSLSWRRRGSTTSYRPSISLRRPILGETI